MEELRDDKNHKIVSELSVWGVGLFGIGDVGFDSNFFCYVVYTGECLKLGLFSLFALGEALPAS